MLMTKRLGAEFLGTFWLVFGGLRQCRIGRRLSRIGHRVRRRVFRVRF